MAKSTFKSTNQTIRRVESLILQSDIPAPEKLCQGLLVALSGGADSVALLKILAHLGYKCVAVHCNFRLRAEESNRDEKFVKDLCRRMCVPLYIKHFDTEEWALQHSLSIETAARELRYNYFSTLGQELGIDHIAIGHHMDDDVETLLLNIIRGAGLNGLRGMQPTSTNPDLCGGMTIMRPLLALTHKEIMLYLLNEDQTWVDDSTNFKADVARNKVRLEVLPMLERINPAARSNIMHMKQIMCEVSKVYGKAIGNDIEQCVTGEATIDISRLRRTESPMCVLHELLSPKGFNGEQLAQILASTRSGATFRSPTHVVVLDREHLIVRPLTHAQDGGDAQSALPHPLRSDTRFHIECLDTPFAMEKSPAIAYIDTDKVKSTELQVRLAKRGDTIAPLGMKGRRKLVSDILTDAKVNVLDKQKQLVVTDGDEVVWVTGHRTSELYKLDAETKHVLKVRFVCEQTCG